MGDASPAASPRRAASPSPARLRTQAVGACQGANGLGRQPRPRQSKRRSPRTSKAPPSRPLGDRGDVSRFKRPSEQAAQRVDEVTGCRWRGASLVAAGDNIAALPLREARFAKRLHESLEDVFALASRRQGSGRASPAIPDIVRRPKRMSRASDLWSEPASLCPCGPPHRRPGTRPNRTPPGTRMRGPWPRL